MATAVKATKRPSHEMAGWAARALERAVGRPFTSTEMVSQAALVRSRTRISDPFRTSVRTARKRPSRLSAGWSGLRLRPGGWGTTVCFPVATSTRTTVVGPSSGLT